MGGNMLGVGNCGQYTGEFNFYGDPESAKIVLDKYAQQVKLISNRISRIELTNHNSPFQCPLSVVTWEATCLNNFPMSILSRPDSEKASGRLLHEIKQHCNKNYCLDKDGNVVDDCEILAPLYHEFKSKGVVLCDLIAAIYCLYPELATVVERFPCTVELDGKYTR